MLSLKLADEADLKWAQQQCVSHHYLHTPVDVRCRPQAYVVMLDAVRPVGCLIFGRPEATRVSGWYGSVEDVLSGKCRLTRWQVLNLARVYLAPCIQRGGEFAHPNYMPGFYDRCGTWHSRAASYVITLALERVPFEYLYYRPPVWMDQPYEIVHILSYCDTQRHKGTIYQAARFERVRVNAHGIETYRREVRPLTEDEHIILAKRSEQDHRAKLLRARERNAHMKQLTFEEVTV